MTRSCLVLSLIAACGGPAAVTTPAPAPAAGETPCFDGPPLVASTVYYDLQKYAAALHVWDGSSPLPSGAYGSCTVRDAVVAAADGTTVAHLGCGIEVEARGLTDHLGLQVGASGKQVIERHQGGVDRLVCVRSETTSSCWFQPPEREYAEPTAYYTVDGALPSEKLEGEAAREFLAARTIARFQMTIYCH